MHLVVVGAGSSAFGLSALRELYSEPVLAGSTLWLVDLDPARLEQTAQLAAVFEEATSRGIEVRCTSDRLEALPGADAVVVAVEVDRQRRWETDAEICRRHGIRAVLAENAGPGGLSHSLRTIGLVAAIARDVQALCPDAWLLSFTNPEGRICTALHRHLPEVRVVGLCHEVRLAQDRHLRARGLQRGDLTWRAGGLNHITALLEPADLDLGALLADEHESPQHQLVAWLQEHHGYTVATTDNHVGEYLSFAADHTPMCDPADWGGGIRDSEEALVQAVLTRSFDARHLIDLPLVEALVPILRARVTGAPEPIASAILPNDGLLPQLPAGCAVEVSAVATADGPVGVTSDDLPAALVEVLQTEVEIQQLVADAAFLGSRSAALQALVLDPTVPSPAVAEALLADLEAAHRDLWPALV